MKIRSGFVSNSSSSSFILDLSKITTKQFNKIKEKNVSLPGLDAWTIDVSEGGLVYFNTWMDNFSIEDWRKFFKKTKIDISAIKEECEDG